MTLSKKLLIGLFIGFIGFFFMAGIISKDKEFSEQENRMLAQTPEFTFESFLSGKFTKEFETYIDDQFFLRDFWTMIKSNAEVFMLKKENNGIYFGDDGFLLEPYKKPVEQLERNIQIINKFAESDKDMHYYLLLAPTSAEIYKDKLPSFTSSYSQRQVLDMAKKTINEKIRFIDVYDSLSEKKDEEIYFKTDHHWTMNGAFYAYQAAMHSMDIEPYKKSDFDIKEVSDDFYGTYYTKAKNMRIQPDAIDIFEAKNNLLNKVSYIDEKKISDSLYKWDYLKKKDKYSVFLNGNHGLIEIKTKVNNNEKIAVIKDSYAHAFIPFLVNHYKEVHVIDLRYYHLGVHEYLKEHNIKNVLFLYNISNFSDDTNMVWLR